MKYIIRIFTLVGLFLFAAQANAQDAPEWKEMETFHEVMSQTWHPIEEGNYEPIKARCAELSIAAQAWKKSTIPEQYKSVKDIKKLLKELASESKELTKEISKGTTDEEIKEDMSELHDIFHAIIGLCKE